MKNVRLLIRVVHPGDQDVFEHEPLGFREMCIASRQQCREIVFAIHRHDPAAHLVRRAVRRDREPELGRLGRQFANLWRGTRSPLHASQLNELPERTYQGRELGERRDSADPGYAEACPYGRTSSRLRRGGRGGN